MIMNSIYEDHWFGGRIVQLAIFSVCRKWLRLRYWCWMRSFWAAPDCASVSRVSTTPASLATLLGARRLKTLWRNWSQQCPICNDRSTTWKLPVDLTPRNVRHIHRTGSSNRPWLIRQTCPMSSGVTRNSGAVQIIYPSRAIPPKLRAPGSLPRSTLSFNFWRSGPPGRRTNRPT